MLTFYFSILAASAFAAGGGPQTLIDRLNGTDFNQSGIYWGDIPITYNMKPYDEITWIAQSDPLAPPRSLGKFQTYVNDSTNYLYHLYTGGSTDWQCDTIPYSLQLAFACSNINTLVVNNIDDNLPCALTGTYSSPDACGISFMVGEEAPTSSVTPSVTPSESASASETPSASPIHLVPLLIADSGADFRNFQGNNGWFYNYYDVDWNYQPLPNYGSNPLGVPDSWIISGSYCRISAIAIHGNTPNNCASPPSFGWCYPSLKWFNMNYTYVNEYRIQLTTSHTQYSPAIGIDGAKVNISFNDIVVDSFQTPFTITRMYNTTNLTTLELLLDPIQDCNNDKTDQNIKIYAMVTPPPSTTPSVSPSQSISPSRSPSSSPINVCNYAISKVWGTTVGVSGDVHYDITHGDRIIHPYAPDDPMLVGINPNCVPSFGVVPYCQCTFQPGDTRVGCSSGRRAYIKYVLGGSTQTNFFAQNPPCTYYFTSTIAYGSPSPSPSPSISPSTSESVTATQTPTLTPSRTGTSTGTATNTASKTGTKTQTATQTSTNTHTVSPTITPAWFITSYPSLSGTQTATPSRTPAFIVSRWPSKQLTPSNSGTPQFAAIPYPSMSSSAGGAAAVIELEPSQGEKAATVVAATAAAAAGAGVIAVVVAQFAGNAASAGAQAASQAAQQSTQDDGTQPSENQRARAPSDDGAQNRHTRAPPDDDTQNQRTRAPSDDGTQNHDNRANRNITYDNGIIYSNLAEPQSGDDDHIEDCKKQQDTQRKQISPTAVVLDLLPSKSPIRQHAEEKKTVDESNAATLLINKEDLDEILALLDRKQKAYICPK